MKLEGRGLLLNLLNWDNVQNAKNSLCYTNAQRKVKRGGKRRLKILFESLDPPDLEASFTFVFPNQCPFMA